MKILIGASIEADYSYEEKILTSRLKEYFKEEGDQVDTFFIPYYKSVPLLPEQLVAYQMMPVENADILITIGYPACYLNHFNKRTFLFTLEPLIHEYYGTEYSVVDGDEYHNIKNAIVASDNKILSLSKKIVVSSKQLQDDLKSTMGFNIEQCYLPDLLFNNISNIDESDKFLVMESNFFPESRFEIILEAMKSVDNMKLLVFAPRINALHKNKLLHKIKNLGIEDKVKIFYQVVSDDILRKASAFISMNYNTRRISNALTIAVKTGRRLIIAADAGAELELTDKIIDTIVLPNSDAVAFAINSLEHQQTTVVREYKTSTIHDIATLLVSR